MTMTSGISSILFEVGIPNPVCGYVLGFQRVAYCFQATVTLSYGLSYRKTLQVAHILCRNPKYSVTFPHGAVGWAAVRDCGILDHTHLRFDVWIHFCVVKCRILFLGHYEHDLDVRCQF